MEFDWDHANTGHIDAHGVEPIEAEEAVLDVWAVALSAHRGLNGVSRTVYVGATSDGRLLLVVVTVRGTALRVVTARDVTEGERARDWR